MTFYPLSNNPTLSISISDTLDLVNNYSENGKTLTKFTSKTLIADSISATSNIDQREYPTISNNTDFLSQKSITLNQSSNQSTQNVQESIFETPHQIRIILADDAEDLRKLLFKLLMRDSRLLVVGEASDGITAVRLCRALLPDVLLLDLSMPGSDGLNTLEAVRMDPGTAVVVLSGLPRGQVEHACLQRGASFYLEKGISTSSIIDAVLKAAGRAYD
jgi:CheY-like chemotaxis protein